MVLGDLIWDFFDQKKIIKKSAEEFVKYYKLFELHLKSDSETFKKNIEEEIDYKINNILRSYYLIAYVCKAKFNKQLSFQSVWQKEEFFVQDILLQNKDIRKVFTTEYQIILKALENMGSLSKNDIKAVVDDMHSIVIKKTRASNEEDEDEQPLSDFSSLAIGIDRDLKEIEKTYDENIDLKLKELIDSHYWG